MPSCEKITVKVSTLHSATTFSAAILEKKTWESIVLEENKCWKLSRLIGMSSSDDYFYPESSGGGVGSQERVLNFPPSGHTSSPPGSGSVRNKSSTSSSCSSSGTLPSDNYPSTSLYVCESWVKIYASLWFGLCHRTPPRQSGTEPKTLGHFKPLQPRMVYVAWLFD